MKILMITPDCYMIDRRIILEARTLVAAGYHVTLLAGFECEQEEHYTLDDIVIHRYQYDWDDERLKKIRQLLPANERLQMLTNKTYMFFARRFFKVFPFEQFIISKSLEFDADIIHVHDLPCLKSGWYASQIKNIPLIYDAHELYYAQDVLPAKLQKKYFLDEKKYIKYPKVVITVNSFIASLIAERYKIPVPNVIMNCTQLPKNFKSDFSQNKIREKGNIPDHFKKIVLYQGWLSAERNLDTLVKGVNFFPKNTCLAIIGYGAYEKDLEELSRQEGVQDQVFFLGQVPSDEMLNYSCGADIGVIPYKAIDDNHLYCSPNKFFEYVLAGVPIVTGKLPFFQLMKEKYGIIEITDMESPEAFGNSVFEILSNTLLLNKMKNNCYKAGQELNWENEGRKLLSIYDTLTKGSKE